MKKILFFLFFLLISGCYTKGTYKINLTEVDTPYGKQKKINSNTFKDDNIKILWKLDSYSASFVLENKTEHVIKIVWDDVVWVSNSGNTYKTFHSDTKYIDKEKHQIPSIIVSGARIEDSIIPSVCVSYSTVINGWIRSPILQAEAKSQKEFRRIYDNTVGKTIKIYFPLQIKNNIVEYIFNFKIEDFEYPKY